MFIHYFYLVKNDSGWKNQLDSEIMDYFFFIFLNIREENINITFKGAVLLYAFAQSITMPTQWLWWVISFLLELYMLSLGFAFSICKTG